MFEAPSLLPRHPSLIGLVQCSGSKEHATGWSQIMRRMTGLESNQPVAKRHRWLCRRHPANVEPQIFGSSPTTTACLAKKSIQQLAEACEHLGDARCFEFGRDHEGGTRNAFFYSQLLVQRRT